MFCRYKPGEFPLPSETQAAEFYRMASSMLADAGYKHYEVSSYCKNDFESRHNFTYWKNQAFYAFGLGSASYIGGLRFSRPKKLKEYAGYVQDLEDGVVDCRGRNDIDITDFAMDVVMLSLRTAKGLDLKYFSKVFGDALVSSLCKAYGPYIESGHVLCLDEQRRVIPAGEDIPSYLRLSDPDGFLLSNELISTAFRVIAP